MAGDNCVGVASPEVDADAEDCGAVKVGGCSGEKPGKVLGIGKDCLYE